MNHSNQMFFSQNFSLIVSTLDFSIYSNFLSYFILLLNILNKKIFRKSLMINYLSNDLLGFRNLLYQSCMLLHSRTIIDNRLSANVEPLLCLRSNILFWRGIYHAWSEEWSNGKWSHALRGNVPKSNIWEIDLRWSGSPYGDICLPLVRTTFDRQKIGTDAVLIITDIIRGIYLVSQNVCTEVSECSTFIRSMCVRIYDFLSIKIFCGIY